MAVLSLSQPRELLHHFYRLDRSPLAAQILLGNRVGHELLARLVERGVVVLQW
jgi:hypothetical protein